MVRWQSGRMRLTRNQLYLFQVPRVQIPVLPPINKKLPLGSFFVYSDIYKPAHKKNWLLITATDTNSKKLG